MFTPRQQSHHASFIWHAVAFALLQACAKPVPFSTPDRERFHREVASPALRDSLALGKLTMGMPYFVAAEVCTKQKGARRQAVASPGSRQPLKESEGLGRRYVDPTLKVFMDEYKTPRGTLRLWYRFPDFYRLYVASGDTLVAYSQEQHDGALIACLLHENRLQLAQPLPRMPVDSKLYGEIHHANPPDGRKISFWYNFKCWPDRQTFGLTAISYELYPIVWMELEGEPIATFQWK